MINVTPAEVISDMVEAASSSKSLECFSLFVDFLGVLHIFEKLNELKKNVKKTQSTLTATL